MLLSPKRIGNDEYRLSFCLGDRFLLLPLKSVVRAQRKSVWSSVPRARRTHAARTHSRDTRPQPIVDIALDFIGLESRFAPYKRAPTLRRWPVVTDFLTDVFSLSLSFSFRQIA